MTSNISIVLAEDNEGHAILIKRNLKRANVQYPIIHLQDGEETLNFFERRGDGPRMEQGMKYILLLDISMPKMTGIEILTRLKNDPDLKGIPVIIVTTTDNPLEIQHCYDLGCTSYIMKHIDYHQFSRKIRELGSFILGLDPSGHRPTSTGKDPEQPRRSSDGYWSRQVAPRSGMPEDPGAGMGGGPRGLYAGSPCGTGNWDTIQGNSVIPHNRP